MFAEYNKEERKEYLEEAEELAAITSYIIYTDLLNGTFFNTFDKAWKLAQNFLKEYPLTVKWGLKEGLEWDVTVEEFVKRELEKQ